MIVVPGGRFASVDPLTPELTPATGVGLICARLVTGCRLGLICLCDVAGRIKR